jgi:LuxR family transcriptional regulator, maltose regulon positive regulatory protein
MGRINVLQAHPLVTPRLAIAGSRAPCKLRALKQDMLGTSLFGQERSLVGRVAAKPAGDLQSWVGSSFELVESKLHPPPARPGIVDRIGLVERLLASHAVPVVCVVAPAGYGKTTLLAQWAQRTAHRVSWVSVDQRDNDPAVLLTYLAVALDRVEPIDPRIVRGLGGPGASIVGAMARLAAAMAAMTQPVALVLDHLELLENQECLDVMAELAAQLPAGAQLLVASRARPPLPVALLRARGRVVELGVEELAMDDQEAHALLQGAGVGLDDAAVNELLGRTEGWPVGLYLAALAHKAGGSRGRAWAGFTGDDRFVADYLWSELLGQLPPERVAFLTRTAVLDRMYGPLCDAVMDSTGSGAVLAWLEESNLLLVPLDRQRRWYRYHHLFQELLRAELERREPELVPELHARAAEWCEANGLPETAIDHAQAAGDTDRVARLVWRLALPVYGAGRVDTARRWFGWFEDQGLLGRYRSVAVLGAWLQALVGEPVAAERWADAAEHGPVAETLPDGSTGQSFLALLRALLCRDGVDRMRADTQAALAELDPGSQWRPTAQLLEGICYLLAGQADRADVILAHAAEVGTESGAPPAVAIALAERSVVAMHQQDWMMAATLAEQAQGVVRAGQLDGYVASALVHAVAARVAVHQGDLARAQQHLARATRLRPLLTYALPYFAVQTLLELGRVCLAVDDATGARVVVQQAREILRRRPDLGILPGQAEELWSKLDISRGRAVGVSALTTAELRLLPLLPTHLTFREIGQRLYVSPHTVKTQALSVYRKLGVSSRSQAVQRAQQLGLGG